MRHQARDVRGRGGVVGLDGDRVADRHVADVPREVEDRQRAAPSRGSRGSRFSSPSAPSSDARRRPRRPAGRPGTGPARRRSCRACSDTRTLPDVSAPIATSTCDGSRVDDVHDEPDDTAKPRPVQLPQQRLAVGVQAGEGDDVRQPVDGVAQHLDVGHQPGHLGPQPVDHGRGAAQQWPRARPRPPAATPPRPRWQARRARPAPGRPRARPAAVASATARRSAPRVPRRPGRPTSARPRRARTTRRAGRRGPLPGSRPRPAAGRRRPAAPRRRPPPAAGCRPRGWPPGERPPRRPRSGRRQTKASACTRAAASTPIDRAVPPAAACWSAACSTAECSTALCTNAGRRRSPASVPSTARCSAWVPPEVKLTSSARAPSPAATASRAASSSTRERRPGPCSRSGSAQPSSSAATSAARATGCSGAPDAASRYPAEPGSDGVDTTRP